MRYGGCGDGCGGYCGGVVDAVDVGVMFHRVCGAVVPLDRRHVFVLVMLGMCLDLQ